MGQAPDALNRIDNYTDGTAYVTSDADTDSSSETEAIVEDIEQTRTELSGTIDAIQDRLNPDHLKDQAREMVRDATVGKAQDMVHSASDTARDTGNGILETIKQNPLPAALAGIGIGWLWKNRSQSQNSYSQSRYNYGRTSSPPMQPYYYQPPSDTTRYQPPYQYQSTQSSSESSRLTGVTDTASNIASGVGHTAGQAVDQVSSVTHGAVEHVGQFGSQAERRGRKSKKKALKRNNIKCKKR
jgi:hypothetical protein